jgi:hypothetical protein
MLIHTNYLRFSDHRRLRQNLLAKCHGQACRRSQAAADSEGSSVLEIDSFGHSYVSYSGLVNSCGTRPGDGGFPGYDGSHGPRCWAHGALSLGAAVCASWIVSSHGPCPIHSSPEYFRQSNLRGRRSTGTIGGSTDGRTSSAQHDYHAFW